jgi:hypothetical protein
MVTKEPKGYYQLQGRYIFRNTKTGKFASVAGYSTCTKRKPRWKKLQILREQAIDFAIERLSCVSPDNWVVVGIEHEVWIKW